MQMLVMTFVQPVITFKAFNWGRRRASSSRNGTGTEPGPVRIGASAGVTDPRALWPLPGSTPTGDVPARNQHLSSSAFGVLMFHWWGDFRLWCGWRIISAQLARWKNHVWFRTTESVCVLPVAQNDFRRGHELSPFTPDSLISDQAWLMNPTKVTLLLSRFFLSVFCSHPPPSITVHVFNADMCWSVGHAGDPGSGPSSDLDQLRGGTTRDATRPPWQHLDQTCLCCGLKLGLPSRACTCADAGPCFVLHHHGL